MITRAVAAADLVASGAASGIVHSLDLGMLLSTSVSFVPVASLVYVLFSKSKDSKKYFKMAVQKIKGKTTEKEKKKYASEKPENVDRVIKFLKSHNYEEECVAALMVALDLTKGNIDKAIAIASKAIYGNTKKYMLIRSKYGLNIFKYSN